MHDKKRDYNGPRLHSSAISDNPSTDAFNEQAKHMVERSDGGIHLPSDKYARRPRHKPKSDRYEYKDAALKTSRKRRSKRSARRRSEVLLNEAFQAPNVVTERLTLKSSSGPGFLANGRYSANVDWKGLPDLTFSEMKFLQKKRQHDIARFQRLEDGDKNKKAPNPANQEMPEFFSRPTESHYEAKSAHAKRHMVDRSVMSPSKSLLLRRQSSQVNDGTNDNNFELDHVEQQSTHNNSRSSIPADRTYISCSVSPSRNQNQAAVQALRSFEPLDTLRLASFQHKQERGRVKPSVGSQAMSSASNDFLKDLTTTALLDGVDAFARRGKQYYSLDDLKHLARQKACGKDSGVGINLGVFDGSSAEVKPSWSPITLERSIPSCHWPRTELHHIGHTSRSMKT